MIIFLIVFQSNIEFKELTGIWPLSIHTDVNYSEDEDFHGDGYSLAVYGIDKFTARKISIASQDFLDLPHLPSVRKKWFLNKWRKTPLTADDTMHLKAALSEQYLQMVNKDDSIKLARAYKYVRILVRQPGSYYAFFVEPAYDGESIDFYILSPSERKFVEIEQIGRYLSPKP